MAAYLYLDESGNLGWPTDARTGLLDVSRLGLQDGKSEPFMAVVALGIHDKKSKAVVAQAVSRAGQELRRYHRGFRSGQRKFTELKGHDLRGHEDIRLRFLKRLHNKAQFDVYIMAADKRRLARQRLPDSYMERYSMLVMNLLPLIQIGRNMRWLTMVVDSQARATKTFPNKIRYSSKRQRLRQKTFRGKDRARRQTYNSLIVDAFKKKLERKGTHLAVYHVRSEDDRCLQAVDVIVNLWYEGEVLHAKIRSMLEASRPDRLAALLKNRRWKRLQSDIAAWQESWRMLQPHVRIVRTPNVLMRGKIARIRRRRPV